MFFSRSKPSCHTAHCAHVKDAGKKVKSRRRPLAIGVGVGVFSVLAMIMNSRVMLNRLSRSRES